MIDATHLVMNTETGRVFYATEAMQDRATIRRLSEDESNAYLEKIAKEAEAREAAQPKPPDTTQAMGLLRELLQGMTAEAVLQLANGATSNSENPPVSADATNASNSKRGRPKKTDSGSPGGDTHLTGLPPAGDTTGDLTLDAGQNAS
ncbi:MAG: hypothetical protein ABTR07_17560 [Candidatus Competibacter denitrificans]